MEFAGTIDTLKKFYKDRIVTAIIGVEAEVKKVEDLARSLSAHNNVEDVYVVTGEFDILLKVRFVDFFSLNEFLVQDLSKLPGVKGSKTMMVLSSVKDMGKVTDRVMSGE
ncbi:MAG: Lrp/AsnC ligand binding domain-containing protein [Candidatus Thermoplasmatota archaeon]|jgi:DNA-binding Lrp family transcriptional regulator|nr:Lrp/AsnC ligand binding domain-containing protein [Candidatus Thermoplasmatota archaeon]MCL5785599.1 Lrp/AsnC ligand binding domain-containing protein [Candidatus Thermoplasmatota archaeon]